MLSRVQSHVSTFEDLLGDVDVNGMDTSDDQFDDAMSCTGYDTPC